MKFKFEIVIGMTVSVEAHTFQEAEQIAKTEWVDCVEEAWVESCNRIPENQRSPKDGK